MLQKVTIEQKLNVNNLILKVVIDQVVGGAANTILFLFLITAVRGGSLVECTEAVRWVSVAVCPGGSSSIADLALRGSGRCFLLVIESGPWSAC